MNIVHALATAEGDFGETLEQAMQQHNISMRELSRASGIAHSTVSRVLGHSREPCLVTARALSNGMMRLIGQRML